MNNYFKSDNAANDFAEIEKLAKSLLQEALISSDAKELYGQIVHAAEAGVDLNYFNPLGYHKNTLLINFLRNTDKPLSFMGIEKKEQELWQQKIVYYLLDNGVDIDYQNGEGITALMCAIRQPPFLNLLLKKGANLYLKDNRGVDAVGYALKQKNWSSLSILMEQGLTPEANYSDYLDIFQNLDSGTQQAFGAYYRYFKKGADIQAINAERIDLQNQISSVAQKSDNLVSSKATIKI